MAIDMGKIEKLMRQRASVQNAEYFTEAQKAAMIEQIQRDLDKLTGQGTLVPVDQAAGAPAGPVPAAVKKS